MLCGLIAKTSGKARIGDFSVDDPEDCLKISKDGGVAAGRCWLDDSLSAYKNLDFYGKLNVVLAQRREENIKKRRACYVSGKEETILWGPFPRAPRKNSDSKSLD